MRLHTHGLIALTMLTAVAAQTQVAADNVAHAGTRLAGLRTGEFAVGFEVKTAVDQSRRTTATGEGRKIGLALWFPARPGAAGEGISSLDYRLLDSPGPIDSRHRQAREDSEVDVLIRSRHVGIVDQTRSQAQASLAARGIAVRNAVAAGGRFPLVIILGGPYYLSTTAEVLATHGFLVAAPFPYADPSNRANNDDFRSYFDNSVRDAEWALSELRRDSRADVTRVAALGHGGGGMSALLLAMRSREIDALVNIDAGNFSTRSDIEKMPFYSPDTLTAPYLYIATGETRQGQDRFEQFRALRFSDRTEIVLNVADLRHHDLSDLGRAVTAPLGIRGEAQAKVQQAFSDVQEMAVSFLREHLGGEAGRDATLASWLARQNASGRLNVSLHRGQKPSTGH